MRGGLRVRVEGGRVVDLEATPPLGVKVLDGPTVLLVGTAAGLLGGDVVTIEVHVGAGSSLTVLSTAATVVYSAPTRLDVRATVGPSAHLDWRPEPLVACAGCRHRSDVRVDLAATATASWREVVALGRTGEPVGRVELTISADYDGRPLVRDGLRIDEAAASPAVIGAAKFVGSLHTLGERAARGLQLAGPGSVVRALAPDAVTLETLLSDKEFADARS